MKPKAPRGVARGAYYDTIIRHLRHFFGAVAGGVLAAIDKPGEAFISPEESEF